MASIKHAQNKLLKSGFLPQVQTEDFESWISVNHRCVISFYKDGKCTDTFKVSGSTPDRPEYDDFNSYYTTNLAEAIRVGNITHSSK